MHQVGHEIDQRLRLALVADIGELDAGGLKQLLRGQVDRGAGAGIAEIELARLAARQVNEFADAFRRQGRVDNGHALGPDRQPDAFQILHRVPAGVLVEAGIDQRRGARDEPGVAVGIAARDSGGADIAVAAGPRLHDDGRLEIAAGLFGHGARDHVDDAAGRVGDDDADRPVRPIVLRLRGKTAARIIMATSGNAQRDPAPAHTSLPYARAVARARCFPWDVYSLATSDLMLRASPRMRGPHSRSICSAEKRNEGMPQLTDRQSPDGVR